ncbi:MAG: glucose-6-phosphate dehydrogenase [Candidatus Izemoplasmatales bacterium]
MKQVLTIFGATGNLMHKKLVPALNQLVAKKIITENTKIYCVSRRDYTNLQYIEHLETFVKSDFSDLKPMINYVKMDIQNIEDYKALKVQMDAWTEEPVERLFYLAVAPEFFVTIARGIANSHLSNFGDTNTRVVFEKPFGEDFASAKQINHDLKEFFSESQIYRIDHYLGKDMIQNILVLRFANKLLENNWSHDAIQSIDIYVKETETIMNRGEYYNQTGALKDMVQSHLLQMLALVTMDEPETLSSDDIRKAKIEALRHTSIDRKNAVFGQYTGYTSEHNVPEDSTTETFAFLEARVDTPRWNGVPIYLLTGKKLDEKKAEIVVHFKAHSSQSRLWPEREHESNQLVIGVSDYEGISVKMNVKKPGLEGSVTDALLDYCHSCQKIGNNPEAYEKLLNEFINHNQTLFTSWSEIEASWNIVDPLKQSHYQLMKYDSIDDFDEVINQIRGETHVL